MSPRDEAMATYRASWQRLAKDSEREKRKQHPLMARILMRHAQIAYRAMVAEEKAR